MRPRGMELRTVAPNHMPGRVMSSTYWARPRTLAVPSLRMGELPTIWGRLDIDVLHKDRRECPVWLVLCQLACLGGGAPLGVSICKSLSFS